MRVGICKMWFYICHEVRDLQLGIIGSNRRCSSVMETRSSVLHRSKEIEMWNESERILMRITLI
jgi:hypothetical protein